jgi:predicted enzyme related to lactoylglutathione lyase
MATGGNGFVWYELVTSDVRAASAFYAHVTGWSMAAAGMPGIDYTLAKIGDRQVAGLTGFPPDAGAGPPMWFGYIRVDDVDAAAERVHAAGGAVHRPPSDIPGVGRFALVADPQGAMFMLFRESGNPAPGVADAASPIGWHELHTADCDAALGFYQDLFGWEKSVANDMGPMGIYQTFSVAGTWTGGMMNAGGSGEPRWLYYISVDDIDAATARVVEAGGEVQHGPHAVPGGSWVITGKDPQGAEFALMGSRRA